MKYLEKYLERIRDRGQPELAEAVKKTAEETADKWLSRFDFQSSQTGLLFGEVQSGKTGQMFGIICLAADLGFPVFVILTTDNISLQQQTLERIQKDLPDFCVCGENDGVKFAENELVKPTIIALKKNHLVLKNWANILKSTQFMRGNPLFIIDDEADAASLNTKVNQKQVSSVNAQLARMQSDALCSMYLEVTRTPQANLLQTEISGFRPAYIGTFRPGKGYLGGDFFFPEGKSADCVHFLSKNDDRIEEAVLHHVICSAILFLNNKEVCTGLFHPGVKISSHNQTAAAIQEELQRLQGLPETDLRMRIHNACKHLHPQKVSMPDPDSLYEKVKELLDQDAVRIVLMNGTNTVESSEYTKGSVIAVGGNNLGRGITFPALNTVYYTRTAKRPQADTMWQHSRMFGYDRDPGLIQLYIDPILYNLFTEINASMHSMVEMMESPNEKITLCFQDVLNPTRGSVLDKNALSVIAGGVSFFPSSPENDTFEALSAMLEPYSGPDEVCQINIQLILRILKKIVPSRDFDLEGILGALESIAAISPAAQGQIIVRRNRRIHCGTGALISSADNTLQKSFPDVPVLTMYQIEPGYGWKGKNGIWVPNIRLPQGMLYFQTR